MRVKKVTKKRTVTTRKPAVAPLTLRAQLKVIERFLRGPRGGDLADVLAAMRGPDNNNTDAKKASTVYIRRSAFPTLASAPVNSSALGKWTIADEPPSAPIDLAIVRELSGSWHFTNHVKRACNILDIVTTNADNC
jgi:hypothetical protein